MSGHGEKKSRKLQIFMTALLGAGTVEAAARVAGISPATARRWLEQEDFQAEFKRLQNEITGQFIVHLKSCMGEALEVLRDIMNDVVNPASARVTAARTVLDNAFKALETEDVLSRIEALEAAMEGEKKR
jgi:transposase-like protein